MNHICLRKINLCTNSFYRILFPQVFNQPPGAPDWLNALLEDCTNILMDFPDPSKHFSFEVYGGIVGATTHKRHAIINISMKRGVCFRGEYKRM